MNTRPNQELVAVELVSLLYWRERLFWQSRSNLREPPVLIDIHTLAKEIRRAFH